MKLHDHRAARPLGSARFTVGESLVWCEEEASVFFVDIIGRRIWAWRLAQQRFESWPAPEWVTSIGLRAGGGFVVGLEHRVCLWRPGGPFETLAVPEPDRPGNRLNEGVVAPDGSFWVGTMQTNLEADGSPRAQDARSGQLYRIAPDGTVTRLSDDLYGITNTMAWLPDGRFVTADTVENTLYAYPPGPAGGLGARVPFLAGFGRGAPDGSAMDAQGHVWNVRVAGGHCVIRIAPEGDVTDLVELPCAWPTSICFGGEGLSRMFVTSARFTMEAAHLDANPQEGGLFALETGFRGVAPHRFAG